MPMSDKTLRAINKGRKESNRRNGLNNKDPRYLKPIRRKSEKYAKNISELKKGKKLTPKSQKKVNKALKSLKKSGCLSHLEKLKNAR